MKLHTLLFDELWGHGVRQIFGIPVRTPGQLRDALHCGAGEDRFTLIDVKLERGDVSPIQRGFVSAFKRQVYSS